jgi:hypothetical protein
VKVSVPAIFFMRRTVTEDSAAYILAVDPRNVYPEGIDCTNKKPFEIQIPVPHDQDHELAMGTPILVTFESVAETGL